MDRIARRLRATELEKDAYVLGAVEAMKDYSPVKEELQPEKVRAKYQAWQDAKKNEIQKEGEFRGARDNTVKAEHDFHETVLAVKDQVRAQFGIDSNEYQSIGLKKKSERKAVRKKTQA
ncbi:MAG: hypothetical protein LBS42_11540 [Tannerella sp.]|jgi:hypothetical protein|nr:hypothetical protein [Tannerella sp.]